MTVRENVQMALLAHARRVWRLLAPARREACARRPTRCSRRSGMAGQAERAAGVLAYGDLKRLELAMALARDPRLLLMDEPTAGMAPGRARRADARWSPTSRTGAASRVLFTEHDMDVVFGVADRILVLDRGALIAAGAAEAIRAPSARARGLSGRRGGMMLAVRGPRGPLRPGAGARRCRLRGGAGEAWVLIGRNGAGKSTTMKALIGLLRPTAGSIRFMGEEIAGREPYRIARLGLGYVPEERRIFTELTVMENLSVGRQAARAALPPWTPERLFALFPNLAAMRDRPGGQMSGGEQQMLTIARTLMGNPRLILLDEPSEGLAPLIVEQMAAALAALKGEGMTVLLAEQNLRFAKRVADHAAVIETGRVVWTGTMAALLADAAVRDRYLAV